MRTINTIFLHCTATQQTATIPSIKNYWKNTLKWKNVGYHYIILPDGSYEQLAPLESVTNGVAGYNAHAVHISYIGGIDKNGKAMDNRTPQQIETQIKLLKELKKKFPKAVFRGHNEVSNKACPSYNVQTWLKTIKIF